MAHGFKVGDRVRNGMTSGTVRGLLADDWLIVAYDCNDDDAMEPAFYFTKLENDTMTDASGWIDHPLGAPYPGSGFDIVELDDGRRGNAQNFTWTNASKHHPARRYRLIEAAPPPPEFVVFGEDGFISDVDEVHGVSFTMNFGNSKRFATQAEADAARTMTRYPGLSAIFHIVSHEG